MTGVAKEDRLLAIASEVSRAHEASRDGGLKEFAIPASVRLAKNRPRRMAGEESQEIRAHELEGLPITACGEGVAVGTVCFIEHRLPLASPYPADELGGNLIALDGK